MKTRSKDEKADEMRPEYDLRELLRKGVQARYVERYREGANLVLLAPDVAAAFPTKEAVNHALRLVIQLRDLPAKRKKAAAEA